MSGGDDRREARATVVRKVRRRKEDSGKGTTASFKIRAVSQKHPSNTQNVILRGAFDILDDLLTSPPSIYYAQWLSHSDRSIHLLWDHVGY